MAWVGWRGYQAYTHLQNASAEVGTLQNQLTDVGRTRRDGDRGDGAAVAGRGGGGEVGGGRSGVPGGHRGAAARRQSGRDPPGDGDRRFAGHGCDAVAGGHRADAAARSADPDRWHVEPGPDRADRAVAADRGRRGDPGQEHDGGDRPDQRRATRRRGRGGAVAQAGPGRRGDRSRSQDRPAVAADARLGRPADLPGGLPESGGAAGDRRHFRVLRGGQGRPGARSPSSTRARRPGPSATSIRPSPNSARTRSICTAS